MNHSILTLGELLTMSDEIIKRNAMSILKRLQKTYAVCPNCNRLAPMGAIEYLGDQEYQCTRHDCIKHQ